MTWGLQAWLAADHSIEETQAEMARLQDLADAVMSIAESKVTFRLIQVRQHAVLQPACMLAKASARQIYVPIRNACEPSCGWHLPCMQS